MKRVMFFLACMMAMAVMQAEAVNVSGTVKTSSLKTDEEVVLTGNTTIDVDADRWINKISGDYALTIQGSENLVISSKSHGISVSSLTIAANVTVQSSKDGLNIDKNIVIKKGMVTIDANKDGIYSRNGNITIESGSIMAESGTNCAAISAPVGDVTIKGGVVIIRGAKFGIITDAGSISLAGNITASAGGWALYAKKNITMGEGSLHASSCGGAMLASTGDIKISGDVTVKSTGDGACSMYAGGTVTITKGIIEADCSDNGCAIKAEGNITMKNCQVTADGAKSGIYSDKGSISVAAKVLSKGFWAMWAKQGITIEKPYKIMSPSGGTVSSTTIVGSNNQFVSYVEIGTPPLSGTVNIDKAKAAVGVSLYYILSGEVATLKQNGEKIIPQWQVSNDGENDWQNAAGESDGSYIVKTTDIGKFIRVRISAERYDGYIYSSPRQGEKSACNVAAVQASLEVNGTQIYLKNPKTNQEYLILTSKKNISALMETDWAKATTPTTTSSYALNSTPNTVNYVYTRVKETASAYAGTEVLLSYTYAGTNTYTQGIELTCKKISSTGSTSTLEKDYSGYYCKQGDVIQVTATPIPANATNFQGIYYSSWFSNEKGGTFYADYKCTQTLQSGESYKTVYFKTTKQANMVDVQAEFTKGYNDIAHDALQFNVGDANGRVLITDYHYYRAYLCKGETQTGIKLETYPPKATVYNMKAALTTSTGTAPIVTFQSNGTINIDATNATKGLYYYDLLQNDMKLTGPFSVQVTNYKIESISVTPETITADRGDEFELVAQLIPATSDDEISWQSNNTSIATVTSTGKVKISQTAAIAGTAVITASAGGKSATCNIKISGEKYNLYIDSKQVTTDNMKDVLGDGVFAFDGMSTLSIEGDHTSTKQMLTGSINGLVIDAKKDAELQSSAVVLNMTKNTAITGEGRLTMTRTSGVAIQMNYTSTLSIVGTHLIVNGGIAGEKSGSARLIIDDATIHVTSKESGVAAIGGFKGGIQLNDCKITKPVGAKIDMTTGTITDSEGNVAQEVMIEGLTSDLDRCYDCDNDFMTHKTMKRLRDGRLYIELPNGDVYDAQGQRVRSLKD